MEHVPGDDQHRVPPTDTLHYAEVRQTSAHLRARAANLRREAFMLRANAEQTRRKVMERIQQIHDEQSTWPIEPVFGDLTDKPKPDEPEPQKLTTKTPAQRAEEGRRDRLVNQRAQLADQRHRLRKLHERLDVQREAAEHEPAASSDEEAAI